MIQLVQPGMGLGAAGTSVMGGGGKGVGSDGGGVVGVVNRQIGIGTFSPRLDDKGNSVRGLKAFQELADEFGLHAFECTNYGSEFMRSLA